MSSEPDWADWAQTLAAILDFVTRDDVTLGDRDAARTALADFDRRCRDWRDRQPNLTPTVSRERATHLPPGPVPPPLDGQETAASPHGNRRAGRTTGASR